MLNDWSSPLSVSGMPRFYAAGVSSLLFKCLVRSPHRVLSPRNERDGSQEVVGGESWSPDRAGTRVFARAGITRGPPRNVLD